MAKIVVPSIRRIYKQLTKQVVADLNKPVTAYMPPDEFDCANCVWDAISKKSSGKFDSTFVAPITLFGTLISPQAFTRGRCPVCLGAGKIISSVTKNLKALVKWNPSRAEELEILPVGREGKAVVRIKVLRPDFDTVMGAQHFLVDGVRCELIMPPTIRGLGTQEELVVAYLMEVEVGKDVKK